MSSAPNTLFLHLEAPLQAWGGNSKFVIRRTMEAPTKSGILGLICCAEQVTRQAASGRLAKLNTLKVGVRIDRVGESWWDYHTVGANMGVLKADGKGIKRTASTDEIEALVTRREYLCDASFLVALQGEPELIAEIEAAIKAPKWTPYLGRKCCPPSGPLLDPRHPPGEFCDLLAALKSVPWRPWFKGERPAENRLDCLLEWAPTAGQTEAPDDALVWYDVPLSFDPPAHAPRFVIRKQLGVGGGKDVEIDSKPAQRETPFPLRTRTDYGKKTWGKIRDRRLAGDHYLCVFCKSPASTGQHISYRNAGRETNIEALADESIMQKRLKDVRSLCRLCHDAVTMIEYGLNMGLDRINPEEPRWRNQLIAKRDEIIAFRSLETRRRHLAPEEVE